ncbi:MAG: DUF2190 family protein [Chloroflexi bacterium]|nr:DUF2190 family protein [Chloroflexota bacterium]
MKITRRYTAGEALLDGEVVKLSAAKTVSKATAGASTGYNDVGVADHDAAAGEPVDVVVLGVKEVVADGSIGVGALLVPSSATAGRVVAVEAYTLHNHVEGTPNLYQGFARSTHTHTNPNTGNSSPTDPHSHTQGSTGGPSLMGNAATDLHQHTIAQASLYPVNGKIVGKAEESATSGQRFSMLVCLM